MRKIVHLLLGALALAIMAVPASADDLMAAGKNNSVLKRTGLKIDKIEGGELFYTTDSGQTHRTVSDSLTIHITGDTNLNTAEDAFAAKKWPDAVDGYDRVMRTSAVPWLKDYAAARLQKTAESAGRFDAAVSAWCYLVQKDSATALRSKPAMPADPTSAFIKTAESELDSASSAVRNDEARQAILTFELDLARFRKDDAAVAKVAAELVKSGLVTPGAMLGLVHADLDAKRYREAQQKLSQLKGPLADVTEENDRVFCQAELANFTAPAGAAPTAWEDIALQYMHVVANDPSGPLTPLALLRVAGLHEKFNDLPTALNIYTQIQTAYKNSPEQKTIVEEARMSAGRLKSHG